MGIDPDARGKGLDRAGAAHVVPTRGMDRGGYQVDQSLEVGLGVAASGRCLGRHGSADAGQCAGPGAIVADFGGGVERSLAGPRLSLGQGNLAQPGVALLGSGAAEPSQRLGRTHRPGCTPGAAFPAPPAARHKPPRQCQWPSTAPRRSSRPALARRLMLMIASLRGASD